MAAIEVRCTDWVFSPPGPVVVWLRAIVPAFSLQDVFVGPGEVAVPGEEVSGVVSDGTVPYI